MNRCYLALSIPSLRLCVQLQSCYSYKALHLTVSWRVHVSFLPLVPNRLLGLMRGAEPRGLKEKENVTFEMAYLPTKQTCHFSLPTMTILTHPLTDIM